MRPEAPAFSQPDLSQRADPAELAEWMDEPCSYEEFRACLVDLERVSRLTLGYRPTLDFLDRLCRQSHVPTAGQGAPGFVAGMRPLHIVDFGCGGGDMLRWVARWARRRGVVVKLTGIDINPHAIRAAKEFSGDDTSIAWICGDAYAHVPGGGVDVVLSSLVMHHLPEAEIVRFLAWMESIAERGWFINDLERGAHSMQGFALLARIFRWHRFVRHDGPVSFRRSFRRKDWERMCTVAGLALETVQIDPWRPSRLCVSRIQ